MTGVPRARGLVGAILWSGPSITSLASRLSLPKSFRYPRIEYLPQLPQLLPDHSIGKPLRALRTIQLDRPTLVVNVNARRPAAALPALAKIYVYGYYGFGNVGDDLLLAGLVRHIRSIAPRARFVVRSMEDVPALVAEEGISFNGQEKILLQRGRSKVDRLVAYLRACWKSLRGCSLLVFGGGTLFHARSGSIVNLVLIAIIALMARQRGARIVALGVGVGPLPGHWPRQLMSLLLRLADDFCVRDSTSLENCRGLACPEKVRLTGDIVYSMLLTRAAGHEVTFPKRIVGVTIAASDIGKEVDRFPDFMAGFATAIATLLASGWKIRLLSFQELAWGEMRISDSLLFRRVLENLVGEIELVRVSSFPDQLVRQFEDVDLVIGMRFHGHVIASMLGKPFVGVGRDAKVNDLCNYFGMPFLPMQDVTADNLMSAVKQAYAMSIDSVKLSHLREEAMKNFSQLGKML